MLEHPCPADGDWLPGVKEMFLREQTTMLNAFEKLTQRGLHRWTNAGRQQNLGRQWGQAPRRPAAQHLGTPHPSNAVVVAIRVEYSKVSKPPGPVDKVLIDGPLGGGHPSVLGVEVINLNHDLDISHGSAAGPVMWPGSVSRADPDLIPADGKVTVVSVVVDHGEAKDHGIEARDGHGLNAGPGDPRTVRFGTTLGW